MAKIKTDDYVNLPLDKWNATTYRAYMKAIHEDKYGIPYVANNHAVEGRFIKDMQTKYGNKALKAFIETCFATYKPTHKFPGLNFGFMYSYMRERNLPAVLKQIATEELKAKRQEQAQNTEIDEEWF